MSKIATKIKSKMITPQAVPRGFSLKSLIQKSANLPRRLGLWVGDGVSVVSLII